MTTPSLRYYGVYINPSDLPRRLRWQETGGAGYVALPAGNGGFYTYIKPDSSEVWVPDQLSRNIYVVSTATLTVTHTVLMPVGTAADQLVFTADGNTCYASVRTISGFARTTTVQTINTTTYSVGTAYTAPSAVMSMAIHPAGTALALVCVGGLFQMALPSGTCGSDISPGAGFSNNGIVDGMLCYQQTTGSHIYIGGSSTAFPNRGLFVINSSTGSYTQYSYNIGSAPPFASYLNFLVMISSPTGDRLYLAAARQGVGNFDGKIAYFDTASNTFSILSYTISTQGVGFSIPRILGGSNEYLVFPQDGGPSQAPLTTIVNTPAWTLNSTLGMWTPVYGWAVGIIALPPAIVMIV